MIPEDLRKDLDEAELCFSVQCFRAAAVMSRRCIQQACIFEGVQGYELGCPNCGAYEGRAYYQRH